MTNEEIIGIMGAMPEEVNEILPLISSLNTEYFGGRAYHCGFIHDKKVVVVFSRWGKVAAATTATTLIHQFGITRLLFTGVAGGIDPSLRIGDIVVGKKFYQHDLNAQPFFKPFEIPLLHISAISPADQEVMKAMQLLQQVFCKEHFDHVSSKYDQQNFGITLPIIRSGIIASGDCFVDDAKKKNELSRQLPGLLCVEMEGAAVAQVCHEYQLPFLIIRTISDTAEAKAPADFSSFIQSVAGPFSRHITDALLKYN